MFRNRYSLTALVFAATITAAVAQTSTSPPVPKSAPVTSASPAAKPSTAAQVGTWTRKKWEAVKKELAKDKTKWSDCRMQSREKKLQGRQSWSFLYTCMKG